MNGFDEAKKENRIVAGWLLHYEERKREYERELEEILHGGQHLGVVDLSAVEGQIGDSTGRRAAELADKLAEKKAWLELVEEVEQKLPWKMQIFLRLRREAKTRRGKIRGKPAWVPYVQWRYAEEVAKREEKEKEDVWVNAGETFVRWWNRIVDYAARLAAKKGLLDYHDS